MRERRQRPEGWRSLRVGELELWWTTGEPRATARLPGEPGEALAQAVTITLAVQRADGSGKKIVATIAGKRGLAVPSAGFRDVQTIAVTPAAVRAFVEWAAPHGAWPTGTGTLKTALALPQLPLPRDLEFRPEHLVGHKLIWSHTS
ncbi:MAG: hypothetical protein WKG01_13250 [Kofleriaceae bacterium]